MKEKELVIAIWTNRLQNHISLTVCDYATAICKLVFEHKYAGKKWAEPSDFSTLLANDEAIYMLLPRTKSDGNSYQHIAKIHLQVDPQGELMWAKLSFLSLGNFDVGALEILDNTTDIVYFNAAAPSPGNRHLFATSGSPSVNDTWRCVTCHLKNCSYQSNYIDVNLKHILTLCSGPAYPHFYLSDLEQGKIDNVRDILQDEEYNNQLSNIMLPTIIEDTVFLQNGFRELNCFSHKTV
ncbi:hypothetical protein DICVIV_10065 [Dictyocaulus viviparus]|uniref:Dipeptidylpeptidase IV N-terminal domain-containing protein n=1 Tax=Dictyocaulus viviparus TaxID=29172 RepID=A0A0D8XJC9_DICVI|nr:hypothetical protein DICVIV_10065 [Dictyocaulus viviparus]